SRRRHTRSDRDWSSDVCSSDLANREGNPIHIPWLARLIKQACLLYYSLCPRREGRTPNNSIRFLIEWPPCLRTRPLEPRQFRFRSEERRVGKECRSRWSSSYYA